jgi:uncharacterized protein (TIGR02466 family)
MIEITPFSTHTYLSYLDITGLVDVVRKQQSLDRDGVQISNCGGWQSPAMGVGVLPEFDSIIKNIQELLEPIYAEYGVTSRPILKNYWFNVNNQHSYNTSHTHPGSVFSAVLYLEVPEHSGNLILLRSDNQQAYVLATTSTPKTRMKFTVEAYPGMLVAFPAHVPHYVEQNRSTQDRISVAFNFK